MAAGSLYGAALAGSIGFVGWLALEGRASLGDVALVVQVARMAIGQVQSAARQAAWLAELSFVGERYLWLLDYRPNVVVKPPEEAVPAPITAPVRWPPRRADPRSRDRSGDRSGSGQRRSQRGSMHAGRV